MKSVFLTFFGILFFATTNAYVKQIEIKCPDFFEGKIEEPDILGKFKVAIENGEVKTIEKK